jgi:hypothetical protein
LVLLTVLMGTLVALSEPLLSIRAVASGLPSAQWLQIKEETRCEAMRDDDCLGRYGFTITYGGAFAAGPSDRASKTEGRIEPQVLQRLRELVAQVSSGLVAADKICRPEGVPGIRDKVDLTFSGGAVVRIYDLGGRVGAACHVGNRDRVHELHEHLHSLMVRYYPMPFPSK